MKNPYFCCLGLLIVFAVLLSGCSGKSSDAGETNKTKKFSVGESASVDGLKITVYSVRYERVIDEKGSKLLAVSASGGKKFLIVDMSLENTDSVRVQVVQTMINSEVSDSAGRKSKPNLNIMSALQNGFMDGDLAPGAVRRGEVGYEVMEDAEGLVLSYKLSTVSTPVKYKI